MSTIVEQLSWGGQRTTKSMRRRPPEATSSSTALPFNHPALSRECTLAIATHVRIIVATPVNSTPRRQCWWEQRRHIHLDAVDTRRSISTTDGGVNNLSKAHSEKQTGSTCGSQFVPPSRQTNSDLVAFRRVARSRFSEFSFWRANSRDVSDLAISRQNRPTIRGKDD